MTTRPEDRIFGRGYVLFARSRRDPILGRVIEVFAVSDDEDSIAGDDLHQLPEQRRASGSNLAEAVEALDKSMGEAEVSFVDEWLAMEPSPVMRDEMRLLAEGIGWKGGGQYERGRMDCKSRRRGSNPLL